MTRLALRWREVLNATLKFQDISTAIRSRTLINLYYKCTILFKIPFFEHDPCRMKRKAVSRFWSYVDTGAKFTDLQPFQHEIVN